MTKVIKIYYPSSDAQNIGRLTAAVREEALGLFDSAQVSFSFSSNHESGYLMVFPTQPILSIRISNHTSSGEAPEELLFKQDGNKTSINAEVEGGEELAKTLLTAAIQEAKRTGQDIKYLLNQHKII